MKEAILHKGFSIVDILQVCATFYNMYEYYDKKIYELKDHNSGDRDSAFKMIREWDYHHDAPIALGVLYKKDKETFDDSFNYIKKTGINKGSAVKKILADLA